MDEQNTRQPDGMMSNQEKKKVFSRAAIAAELRLLADDLAGGRLQVGTRKVLIGDPVHLKRKQEIGGESVSFTLKLEMPLLAEEAAAPAEPSASAGEPPEGRESPLFHLQGEPGYSGRKLKKEIGRFWKSVAGLIEAGTMPDSASNEGLLSRCEEYVLFAREDWQADWATCTRLIQKCLTDAAIGDWQSARALTADINRMMEECHRRFKR